MLKSSSKISSKVSSQDTANSCPSEITANKIPLIAILRGVKPENVIAVSEVLVNEGFRQIEVPLNSPNALKSIELLLCHYANRLEHDKSSAEPQNNSDFLIGAGTVTTLEQAKAVIDIGANLIVSPNFNSAIVKSALKANCVCYPGIVTPTEAFDAISAGATRLKVFPVSGLGIDGFKALMSVLPKDISCYPVGGIEPRIQSMKPYLDAGAQGFGLGSSLFNSQMDIATIEQNAKAFVEVFQQALIK